MSASVQGEYEIINALGLHARAAAQLVKTANRFRCEVFVSCEGQTVNGKSIMGVLMLAAAQGMRIQIKCVGEDGPLCLAAMAELIAARFGESQ